MLKTETLNGEERHGQELFATCSAGEPPGGGIKAQDSGRLVHLRGVDILSAWPMSSERTARERRTVRARTESPGGCGGGCGVPPQSA